jgi:hypothetical protein
MAFILSSDDGNEATSGYQRYLEYLSTVKNKFPSSAYQLATSDWYFNFNDHRCPHDAWLESFTLSESSTGKRSEVRTLSLKVRLLGAYHDGHIELHYPKVLSYELNIEHGKGGHRDWRYDELRLSENGNLVHEIEWCGFEETGTWVIEASDVEFHWFPINVALPTPE